MNRGSRARSRRTMIAVVLALCFSTHAAEAAATPESFCVVLEQVNRGGVDTSQLAELEGHARVAEALLDAAPEAIRSDLTALRDTFRVWANAARGDISMLQTFAILRDPEFAGVQGRIADYR